MALAQTLAAPVIEAPAATSSEEERRIRAKLAAALISQGSSAEPVRHWTQGLARVAQALSGNLQLDQLSKEAAAENAAINNAYFGGATPAGAPPSGMQPSLGLRPRTAAALADEPPEPPIAPSPSRLANLAARDSQDTFRTPLDTMAPRIQGLDALKTAMAGPAPAQPAMSGMNPAGAIPVQTQAITPPAPQVAQAMPPAGAPGGQPIVTPSPARSQVDIPSEIRQRINALRTVNSPKAQQMARDLYNQWAKPKETEFIKLDENTLYNKGTGEIKKVGDKVEYNFHPNPDGTVTATNKNDPRDVHVVDPKNAQSLINFKANEAAATETATGRAKIAVQKEGQQEGKLESARIVLDTVAQAKNQINNGYFVTGLTGSLLSNIHGSPAHDLSNTLDTIKANVGFDKLNAMRAASPTGGALGNVTEFENRLLQSTIASVRQSQGTPQLLGNLTKVEQVYKAIIDKGIKPPPGWTPDKPVTPDLYKPEPEQIPAPAIRQTGAPARVGGGKPPPRVGDTEEGWRFKGGDPSKRESWEQVI